jgi:sialate O-acetylesterase
VQLAAFMKFVESEPAQGGWAWIRESQFRGIREAGGGMASAIDLGDADDIHPRRKREVGERLALWAKNRVYGDTTVAWQGPELSKCRRDGSKVVCEFDHADGLRATSGEPGGFALAGADGVFVWARATIQGTRVVLEAPGVTDPVEAVYAWQNNPERANLANGAGLPAVPFRSAVAAKD